MKDTEIINAKHGCIFGYDKFPDTQTAAILRRRCRLLFAAGFILAVMSILTARWVMLLSMSVLAVMTAALQKASEYERQQHFCLYDDGFLEISQSNGKGKTEDILMHTDDICCCRFCDSKNTRMEILFAGDDHILLDVPPGSDLQMFLTSDEAEDYLPIEYIKRRRRKWPT